MFIFSLEKFFPLLFVFQIDTVIRCYAKSMKRFVREGISWHWLPLWDLCSWMKCLRRWFTRSHGFVPSRSFIICRITVSHNRFHVLLNCANYDVQYSEVSKLHCSREQTDIQLEHVTLSAWLSSMGAYSKRGGHATYLSLDPKSKKSSAQKRILTTFF